MIRVSVASVHRFSFCCNRVVSILNRCLRGTDRRGGHRAVSTCVVSGVRCDEREGYNIVAGDQLTFQDPAKRYPAISPPEQHQDEPGLDRDLQPQSDRGAQSYRGTGRLEGRKALITGADSGIGAAVAIAFAREGADVAIVVPPDGRAGCRRGRRPHRGRGPQGRSVAAATCADAEYCRALVADAVGALGGLDILINNAGKQVYSEDLTTLDDEQFDETFKTNVYAMFWITKAALPHLPPGSSIINTSSVQAYKPCDDPDRLRLDQSDDQHVLEGDWRSSWRPRASG